LHYNDENYMLTPDLSATKSYSLAYQLENVETEKEKDPQPGAKLDETDFLKYSVGIEKPITKGVRQHFAEDMQRQE
jgi:hypothetical protein